MNFKCTQCGCERKIDDVIVHRLDGEALKTPMLKCFCGNCGNTHFVGGGKCLHILDFTIENTRG